MTPAKYTCPGCGVVLKSKQALPEGKSVKCPQCGKTFAATAAPVVTAVTEVSAAPPLPEPAPVEVLPAVEEVVPEAVVEEAVPEAVVGEALPEAVAAEGVRTARRRPTSRRAKSSPLRAVVIGLAACLVVGPGFILGVYFWPNSNSTPSFKELPRSAVPSGQRVAFQARPDTGAPAALTGPGFDGWQQDLENAKNLAAPSRKDLLLLFAGSDWCPWTGKMTEAVFATPFFRERVPERFVLVFVDFPHKDEAKAKVLDAARNERLADEYGVTAFPTVVLADCEGKPYASLGYEEEGAEEFVNNLVNHQVQRLQRDQFLTYASQAPTPEKLKAAKAALDFLEGTGYVAFYAPQVEEWSRLAVENDPKNEKEFAETFFEIDWYIRIEKADQSRPEELVKLAGQLDEWKKKYPLKNHDRAARLHAVAGQLLARADRFDAARESLKAGAGYKPTDPYVKAMMANPLGALGFSSGSGFVVSGDGLILTNHHVIAGPGRVLVRLPQVKDPVPAEVLAKNEERDMALLRVKVPAGSPLVPLALPEKQEIHRGEEVAAFGYPLGEVFGSQPKLTKGSVSATPEAGNDNRLILDLKVNPGNSGGPLCDSRGNVVGLISAKSQVGGKIDSYGMALPPHDLDAFLKKHAPGYKPAAALAKKLDWVEVDRLVSGSVLMILQAGTRVEPVTHHDTRPFDPQKSPRKP